MTERDRKPANHCRHARCCQCGAVRGTPEHAAACPDALIARAISKRTGPGRKLPRKAP